VTVAREKRRKHLLLPHQKPAERFPRLQGICAEHLLYTRLNRTLPAAKHVLTRRIPRYATARAAAPWIQRALLNLNVWPLWREPSPHAGFKEPSHSADHHRAASEAT
jgi:hypothetical protein